ncbi:MAG: hypothetical protein JSV86_12010 [Gemmatimonadota bacterium]|nr:MAG: hypothetical protein JSV86_12010 [Gemmatimonadota bacterium]
MGKRSKEVRPQASLFDRARNELLGQIRHCGVLQATEEQKDVWFKETMEYIAKRYPGVTEEELAELSAIGRRYCEPVISYGGQGGADSEGTN